MKLDYDSIEKLNGWASEYGSGSKDKSLIINGLKNLARIKKIPYEDIKAEFKQILKDNKKQFQEEETHKKEYKLTDKWVKYKCVHCGNEIIEIPNFKGLCEHKTKGKISKKYYYPYDAIGFEWEDVPNDIKDYVTRKDYGEILVKETSFRIAGEEKAKRALIILLFGGRLVKNSKSISYNSLLSNLSGTGKDHIAHNTLSLLPEHFWFHKTRLSDRALNYWHPSDKEPFFNWNGKILYCEDVTNKFLNSDTVKVMMTGGSDIAFVDKGELKTIKINGTPLFLVTSATAEPNKELNRRITSVSLDQTKEQTKKILEFQSKAAAAIYQNDYDTYLTYSTYLLTRLTVDIPFSEKLLGSFPMTIQSRTNYDRLLDIIKANAALHQYTRERNGNSVVANEEDLKIGLEIFEYLFPYRNTSLTHAQNTIVDYLKSINTKKTAAEIFREVGFSVYSQLGKMIEGLQSLAEKGFVNISEGERNGRPIDLYEFIPEFDHKKINIFDKEEVTKVSKVSRVSNVSVVSNVSNVSVVSSQKCISCGKEGIITNGKDWFCKKCAYEGLNNV